ncbi:MAG: CvpA family protein [Phycisphaeraceae bacterium]|nr:CvpA family protein [Phycisphaeraceae bacterium]
MIANLLIVAFVLGMAYIWSVYGFFSAFLQLILVIAAGAIALAVWEPLVVDFLILRMPHYAWGVGLLGPFVLALIVLRGICDVLVRKNVHFPRLVNGIGGAACGLLAGILMAGITWIGINFLPLGVTVGGIQPYRVEAGEVRPSGKSLWLSVDKWASGFFNGLSSGAFHTSTPLRLYQPDLPWQAAVYRLHSTDDNASRVAVPGSVEAIAQHIKDTPVADLPEGVVESLGPQVNAIGQQLVVIDTRWTKMAGTYDADSAVRISPTQIRLVTFKGPPHRLQVQMYPPLAYSSMLDFQTGQRRFEPLNTREADVRSNQQSDTFGFVFMIPADEEVQYMLVRHLRLPLPAAVADEQVEQFAHALGDPAPQAVAAAEGETGSQGQTETGSTATAESQKDLELTNRLPADFNRNSASGLSYIEDGTAITSGQATTPTTSSGGQRTRVNSIYAPPHMAAIRLRLDTNQAQGIFGKARSQARSLGGIWLTDQQNRQIQPFAYVWQKGGELTILVDPNTPIKTAADLPVSQMGAGDKIYLYFQVPKPTTITGYHVGDSDMPLASPLEAK